MASDEPPEKDMKDFGFIQLCKFRVSQSSYESLTNRSQLLASSSLYGLLIYASENEGFSVVKTTELLAIDQIQGKDRNKVTVTDFPVEAKVNLPGSVEYLSISAEDLTLAVVFKEAGQLIIAYFDVRSFGNKPSAVLPFAKTNLNTSPNISVVDIAWNPAVFSMLAICLSDGSLQLVDVTEQAKITASLPSTIGASCFSWSPKGKQLLLGKKDGSLAQYDHGLAEKKRWPCPTVFTSPQTVIDVVWLSTYSFLAAYLPIGAQLSDQPQIVLTNSNKENNTKYINFEDPCFSNGEERRAQFAFNFIQKWEMVIIASSRASEATIIGKNLDDKITWEHWNLDDCSRAELPLTSSQNDSYPMGLAVDFSPQNQVVLSETKSLPACPVMFLLTSDGLLLSYHLSYTHKEAAQVTIVPQTLDPSAARKGAPGLLNIASTQQISSPATAPVPAAPLSTPVLQTAPQTVSSSTPSSSSSAAFAPFSVPAFSFGGAGKSGDLFPSSQKPAQPFGTTTPFQANQPSLAVSNNGSSSTPLFSFSTGGPIASKGQSSAFVSLAPASMSSPQQAQGSSALNFGQSTMPAKPNIQPTGLPPKAVPISETTKTQQVPGPHLQQQQKQPQPQPTFTGNATPLAGFGLRLNPGQAQVEGVGIGQQNLPKASPSQRPPAPETLNPSMSQPIPTNTYNAALCFPGQANQSPSPVQSSQLHDRGISLQNREAGILSGSPHVDDSKSSIKATVDSAFIQNITEEIADFEQELRDLMTRSKRGIKPVGNRAEIQTLRQDAEKMSKFLTDIKEATKDQTKEAKDLKSTCYNLLYMAEECNTLHQRNNDPHYHSLLQGRALDPVSAGKLKSLQQMAQSLESTVLDVDHVLDSLWNEHLNREKERMMTSAGETIYKTIKNNHWLINDQRGRLEKLEEQLRCLKLQPKHRKSVGSPLNLLPQTKQVANNASLSTGPTATMTPEKVSRLKEYLLQRKVPVIKSTTPVDLSLSKIVAHSTKRSPSSASLKKASQQQETQPYYQSTPQTRMLPANMNQQQPQTPTGIPPAQLRLAKGTSVSSQHMPGAQTGLPGVPKTGLPGVPKTGLPGVPKNGIPFGSTLPQSAGLIPSESGSPQKAGLSSQAPTAISGVAYFKQPLSQPPNPIMGHGFLTGQHVPPEVQAAAQLLSTHIGSAMTPDGPLAHIPQLLSAAGTLPNQLQPKMQNMYEDITPTETDETNDDDDDYDYDEEDNGYEDEDEEEEEAGPHPGFGQEVSGRPGFGDSKIGTSPVGVSAQPFGQGGPPTASTDLFAVKLSSPLLGGGDSGDSKIVHPNSTVAKQDGKAAIFVPPPPAFGGQASSFNFGFNAGVSSTAPPPPTSTTTTTTTPSIFSGKPSTNKPAFTFGGSASFGQKGPSFAATTSGTTSVFGSLATPSKSVGFEELATGAEKSDDVKTSPSVVQTKAGFTLPSTSTDDSGFGTKGDTTASPSVSSSSDIATSVSSLSIAASSPDATGFTFGGSAHFGQKSPGIAATISGTTPVFGSSAASAKPVGFADLASGVEKSDDVTTSPPAFSFASSNVAVSDTPDAPKSSFGSTPLFGGAQIKSPPISEGVAKTSPFASHSPQTGFSIFAGNKATSPSSASKSGFDAVLSATSPPAAVMSGFSFSPNANTVSSSGGLFGSKASTETGASFTPQLDSGVKATKDANEGGAPEESAVIQPSANLSSSLSSSLSTVAVSSSQPVSANVQNNVSDVAQTPASNSGADSTPSGVTSTTGGSSGFTFGGQGSSVSSTSSIFGVKSPGITAAATTTSIFGGNVQTTASPSAGFGTVGTSSSPATVAPAFGTPSATTTTSSLFGGSVTVTTASSDFGGQSVTSTPSSLFGGFTASSTTTSAPSLFGSTTTSESTPVFGGGSTPANTKSLFSGGVAAASTSSTPSLFSASSSFPEKPLFGTPAETTTASLFGGGGIAVTTAPSLFGNANATSASTVPSFGFGGTTPSASGGLFGASSATSPSTSGAGNLFSSSNGGPGGGGGLFGNSSSTGSIFGTSSTPSSGSSQTGSVFGQAASTSGSLGFGQGQGSSSLAFGQSGNTSSSSLFGSGGAFGLGGKPSEEKAKQNVFGTTQTFGSPDAQNSSLFGGGGSTAFGGVGSGSSFSGVSGGFSSNAGGGVSSAGFGVSSTATFSGFGSAPSFGNASSFGNPGFGSTFGSSPSFGSSATFGTSPSFANTAGSTGSFGTASANPGSDGGFSSFASASAPSFGQLAQGPTTNAFGSPSGGFGSSQGQTSVFGGGGGGGSGFGSFSSSPAFGQTPAGSSFGSGQSPGFGNNSFGGSPAFSSYRG